MSNNDQAPLINVRNGFTFPLHKQQLLSWLGYFIIIAVYLLVIYPSLTDAEKIGVTIPFLILWFGFNTVFLKASAETHRSSILPEESTQNSLRCQWCKRKVQLGSKHCRSCNLCRLDFDHHCFFLNNCVTSDNYGYFFSGIVMLYIECLLCTFMSIYVMMAITLDNNSSIILAEEYYRSTVPKWVWYLILGLFLFMLLGIEVFLTYLLGLHTVLIQKNISTFDVIQFWRAEAASKAAKQMSISHIESAPTPTFQRVQQEERERANNHVVIDKSVSEKVSESKVSISKESDGTSFAERLPPKSTEEKKVTVEPSPETTPEPSNKEPKPEVKDDKNGSNPSDDSISSLSDTSDNN